MATCERTKAALIRRPGYPIGQPAPCFLRCCENEIDVTPEACDADPVTCPTCGTNFSHRGHVVPRSIVVRVTIADGNSLTTRINTDLEGAKAYYIGNWFNLGVADDDMQQAVGVEEVQ